jgi:hypothetical protein
MLGKITPRALACLFLQAALAVTCCAGAGTDSRPGARADKTPRAASLRSSGTGSAAIAVSILKGLAARRKGRKRAHDARGSAALLRALNTPAADGRGKSK